MSRKPNLLPYEVIERATKGEPEAVDMVLKPFNGFIKYSALENGRVNAESEDYIKSQLIAALFKFRFDRQDA